MNSFIEVLNQAIKEDSEVLIGIANLYCGFYTEEEMLSHDGQRIVCFRIPCCAFENLIREELQHFAGFGVRIGDSQIKALGTLVVCAGRHRDFGRTIYSWCEYRDVIEDGSRYNYYLPIDFEGYTLCDKKAVEKLLRKRGWM